MLSKNKTLRRLDQMLEEGINGTFTESSYDESELSRLETKWYRYLTFSQNSRNKIDRERQNLNSLITDISHQTKTAAANTALYTELLREQNLSGEAERFSVEIEKYTRKLAFLTEALVKLSRLEGGMIELTPIRGSVAGLIGEAAGNILGRAESKNIKLTLSDDEYYCFFDFRWTAEALENILDNAVKYTDEGGEVSVTAAPMEIFTRITVKDTGIGIPADDITRIFARFQRGKNTVGKEGIGVGLYLARQIIESEGGYITAQSKEGKGTKFNVFLPNKK